MHSRVFGIVFCRFNKLARTFNPTTSTCSTRSPSASATNFPQAARQAGPCTPFPWTTLLVRFQTERTVFSSLRNAFLARWYPIAKCFFHAEWEACVAFRPCLRCNKFLTGRSVHKFTIFLSKSNTILTGRSPNAASSGFATRLACCTSASSHGRLRLMMWRHRGRQRRWNELRRITQVPGSV